MKEVCAIIRKEVELDTPDFNGSSPREHLEEFEAQKRRVDKNYRNPDLQPKLIPWLCTHAYNCFNKLKRNGDPIKYSEIQSFIEVTGAELSLREVEAIITFDNTTINTLYEIRKKQAQFLKDSK